jgi:signal transduction histidine kinase
MKSRVVSLRAVLGAATAIGATLALVIAGALIVVTAILHRTTVAAVSSVESVRLAQGAAIDLLLHDRTTDPFVRDDLTERVRRKLGSAHMLSLDNAERRALEEAEARLSVYIATAHDPMATPADRATRQHAAFTSLEALVTASVAHASQALEKAAAWDRLTDYIGYGIGTASVLSAVAFLWWLKYRAFAPVFSLSATMERFASGDRQARAREIGPAELREMSRRFNDMAGALAAQRQSQIAFLGGVAHDLRNPLSVLRLSVALLDPTKPISNDRVQMMVQKIARQIDRLERMTGDFLEMAKIDAGELELRFHPTEVHAIVDSVVSLYAGTSTAKRFELSLPHGEVFLDCDHLRIEQVLTNLVSNAIKYSPEATSIEIAAVATEEEVVFRVTDHGVGISEHERARVFEPFRRVGLSKESAPGVGLGLFVVRRIVEAHGGSIDVESVPGIGSSFRVVLPRRHEPASPVTNHPDESSAVH